MSKIEQANPTAVLAEKRVEPAKHYVSIYPKGQIAPADFVKAIKALEKTLKMPIWLLVQAENAATEYDNLTEKVRDTFRLSKADLQRDKPVALLIDSPGGQANCAYQIATFFRRHCGGFTAVIPRCAKSAATLLALGADNIILGREAELGPLDAQLFDPEREDFGSALDEVQSLERLHAFALEALDQEMLLLVNRTGKKVETTLPHCMRFIADMTRPLFEKIDTVHYTQRSRVLKVAEAYAIRLLKPRYPRTAEKIARRLVEQYPEHGFVIDEDEVDEIGLKREKISDEQDAIIDDLLPHLGNKTLIGRLVEGESDDKQKQK